jgi:H+-translocating NAD(P) transhydrogenase subunit alpha
MSIRIAMPKEARRGERWLAMTPSIVQRLIKLGVDVCMQSGAGEAAGLSDAAFENVAFVADPKQLVARADIVLAAQPPAIDAATPEPCRRPGDPDGRRGHDRAAHGGYDPGD